MKIKYKIIDEYGDVISHEGGDVFKTVSSHGYDLTCEYSRRDAAEECAADFWHDHDGESHGWPLTFVLIDDAGSELGTYEVDVETAPRFSASEA